MSSILDRYVGKNIIICALLVSACLTIFASLIGVIDSLRFIGRGSIDFWFVIEYNLYKVPGVFVTFFPVSILIGSVVALGLLAKNSEIVILQSIGLSKLNIGLSCIKSLLPIVIVVMLVGEFVSPVTDKIAEEKYDIRVGGLGVSFTTSAAWFKEGNSIIGISSILDKKILVSVVRYDYEGIKAVRVSRAKKGTYENGQWVMSNVEENTFYDEQVKTTYYDKKVWDLHINVDRLEILSDISANMSILKLADYIKYIEQNGVDSSKYKLSFYNKVFLPFVMFVMLLLALSTIFGPLRSINMSARVVSGIALGFGYYVLNQIVAPFSLVYGVPPIIGASFASIVFALLAYYLLQRKS